MKVQAEMALYPLRTEDLAGPVEAFCRALAERGFEVQMGPMSSLIRGECADVFDAVRDAFHEAAETHDVALRLAVTNVGAH